jgi:WD40 repeat protein
LEFHPTKNNILLSGDKKGQIGVWDFGKVYEKNVYGNIHSVQVNNMRFSPTNDDMVYSASSDGTIGYTDLETGTSSTLLNLNPDGWQVTPSSRFSNLSSLIHLTYYDISSVYRAQTVGKCCTVWI